MAEAQADTVRDILGNRFLSPDPASRINARRSWLTPTVVTLADAIYRSREFDGLPVLADALIEAGCDDERILSHCQAPGVHVRGCWVSDLLRPYWAVEMSKP